jgi:hypothetical protein
MEREQYPIREEGEEEAREHDSTTAQEVDERKYEKAEEREREVFERIREMVEKVKEEVVEVLYEKPKEFVQYCRKEGLSGVFKDFIAKFSSSGGPDDSDELRKARQDAAEDAAREDIKGEGEQD